MPAPKLLQAPAASKLVSNQAGCPRKRREADSWQKKITSFGSLKTNPPSKPPEGFWVGTKPRVTFWTPSICWKFIDRMHQKARLLTRPRQVNISKKVIWTLELWAKQEKTPPTCRKKQHFFCSNFFSIFLLNWKRLLKTTSKVYKLGRRKSPPKKRIHHLLYPKSEQEKTRSLIWLFHIVFFCWVEVVVKRDFLFWIWKFHTLVKRGGVVYCIPKHGSLVPLLLDLLISGGSK